MSRTKINIIATGSSGNLYEIIDSKGNSMLIEAGVQREKYIKNREGIAPPEMCIISHKHSDHAGYANHFEMVCPVHRWQPTAKSANFRAMGFKVLHGDVINYAYIIKVMQDDKFIFFGTDMEWSDDHFNPIFEALKRHKVEIFLLEVNYNDYLYHLADEEMRVGNDRHLSDNEAVRFVRLSGAKKPIVITIHGSERLCADTYTRKQLNARLPTAKVSIAVGAKGGVRNLVYV